MTPKEKAIYLVEDFAKLDFGLNDKIVIGVNHKKQALIAVYQIIDALDIYDTLTESNIKQEFGLDYFSSELQNMENDFRYWNKVKHEIEKL
jgi:hypothetical protein